MRIAASAGFWLLSVAASLWILGSMFSEEGSLAPLNVMRAVGFGLAAYALQADMVKARLLGAGLLIAGLADVLSLPNLLEFLGGFEYVAEASEFIGSLWLVVLGTIWLVKDATTWAGSLRWAVLLIGLTALYWCFASINATDWVWIPGNVAAAVGATVVFLKANSDLA